MMMTTTTTMTMMMMMMMIMMMMMMMINSDKDGVRVCYYAVSDAEGPKHLFMNVIPMLVLLLQRFYFHKFPTRPFQHYTQAIAPLNAPLILILPAPIIPYYLPVSQTNTYC